ncbi:MAG: hypothetical protein PHR64_00720 [Candidatus Shapirobacteria bacterium]|nr:hypothetical protein [Candidatus Shapirobacteria bacterium]MDD5073999.1 hypothetical protein [Candidatus Shapirobacteria bacterium]MDD5481460.1 hypothetical protein [Candidatus Shapirobacteria bacterium]
MKLIFFLVLSILTSFFPKNCQAQAFSLSINPPILEAMLQPGKKIIYTFDLENNSSLPLSLTARIVPFEARGNQGHIRLTNDESPAFFSLLNSGMAFNQPFFLNSQQKIQLVVRVAIPQNQPEGDYYQTLLVEQFSKPIPSGNISQSLGAVGTNILLTVSSSGQPQRSLEIENFNIPAAYFGRFIDSSELVNFNLVLKNTGQAFIKPEGGIFIRPEKEKKDLQEIKIRPDNILPGTSRQMHCLEEPCFFKPPQIIGSYQARFEFVLDGKKYQSAISFWVFPIKITLGLTLLLLFWLILLWRLKRKQISNQ